MNAWFRFYHEVLDDPKVQRLSSDDFRVWVNILCLAARNDGAIPEAADVAFSLRLDPKKCGKALERLVSADLIDVTETGMVPHGWNNRQYRSDGSTERVKRFRERSKTVSSNVGETLNGTGPDSDSDTEQNRAEGTEAKASAEIEKSDPETIMFKHGLALLVAGGKSESASRSILGKWKRDHGTGEVIAALGAAKREAAIEPVAFIEKRWRVAKANNDEGFSIGGTRMSSPC